PDDIYFVDFVGRSLRKFFTSAAGETIYAARWWKQDKQDRQLVVVSTNQFFHIVTEDGQRVVSMPRAFAHEKYGPVFVGKLVDPDRYFVWYHLRYWLREPHEYRDEPTQLIEYDAAGRELARRAVPPIPYPEVSYAQALYGLVTPLAEVSTLVGASKLV